MVVISLGVEFFVLVQILQDLQIFVVESHVSVENKSGDDIFGSALIFSESGEVKLRVFSKNFP